MEVFVSIHIKFLSLIAMYIPSTTHKRSAKSTIFTPKPIINARVKERV